MFQALKGYMNSADNKVVTREEMLVVVESTFTAITKNVIPAMTSIAASEQYFKSDKITVLEQLGGSLELRTTDPKDVVKALTAFFKDIASEERNFIKLINTQTNEKVFPALATVQELAILKTISDVTSAALFVLDLFYYIILDEESEYTAKKVEELRASIPYFSAIVRVYIKGFDKHVSMLYKVSKTEVKVDAPAAMMDKLFAKQGKLVDLPIMNGFINNPIYHVRLWFADRDIDKYESLKEKKKLIELKILDLKMRAAGKHDERLAKQISYYEDKVSGIEYEIKDLSEGL